ncbi:hypothetical protein DPEC_G00142550 [Dallia pectoralis]|uniref:Uncharacterized protein n=1 Tax=Dallia pectoralis TaxID=75939 RepID=A0ACC2GMY3_DALPE|nr:hypothetical protein DPEC_G00142550 [Dallia pectoralis]
MRNNFMSVGMTLFKGDFLTSKDGRSTAIFQDDGNFVVYRNGKVRWASNTVNHEALYLVMQADGNLVIYTKQGPIWASNTCAKEIPSVHPFLRLTDEGNLVITLGGKETWKST